ncbi:hypothetical protein F5051DRAFT_194336 [Lentinula edodes]|nr:hypothetical protein F5051DRAFT_194336 [Lentinula edodes]
MTAFYSSRSSRLIQFLLLCRRISVLVRTTLIGGTDRGCALVYDVETGKVDQSLKYHLGGLVQAVATASTSDHFLVAIAGSNGRQASNVVLWQKKRPSPSILRSTLSKKSDPDVLYIPLNKNTFDDLHLFSATLWSTFFSSLALC